jgi:hypothetical protein
LALSHILQRGKTKHHAKRRPKKSARKDNPPPERAYKKFPELRPPR